MANKEVWTWNHKNSDFTGISIAFNDDYEKASVDFSINNDWGLEAVTTFTKLKDIERMAEFLTLVAKRMRSKIDASQD